MQQPLALCLRSPITSALGFEVANTMMLFLTALLLRPESLGKKAMDCRLVLADGSVWPGKAFGYTEGGSQVGEVVFNTTLTGYQELLTDPSYKGQFVCYTVPHIGNVGINLGTA